MRDVGDLLAFSFKGASIKEDILENSYLCENMSILDG